ncbi:MAG: tetratricopeptide repeat protein, partial [Myxococcota bacterium]|nr:tetratricopeptide repeat protein [Myxococcota bacterium]
SYERVLKEDPTDVRARLNLANLYYRREDYPRAVETFLAVAQLYEEAGATLKAIAVYKQAIKLDPDRADVFVLLADNYERHGLLNEAGSSYQHALRLLGAEGDKTRKLDVIQRILELDPDNLVDRLRLAEAYSALGQLNNAVRQFRRVAMELDRLGHAGAFQRIGERLLYHQPDDAMVAKKLATSYVRSRKPQRALSKLKIAFKHSPRDLEVLGTLVDAFEMVGQVHKAVTVLKEMARQYDKSGLTHERDDCYREILTLDPDDDSATHRVRPVVSAHEGQTIEFEEMGSGPSKRPRQQRGQRVRPPASVASTGDQPNAREDSATLEPASGQAMGPPPVPPPLPEVAPVARARGAQGRQAGQLTGVMEEGDKSAAREASMALETPPSTPISGPPTVGDLAAEVAIDQLLQDSLQEESEDAREAVEERAARPVSEVTVGDLEALFAAALDEVNSGARPPTDQGEVPVGVIDQVVSTPEAGDGPSAPAPLSDEAAYALGNGALDDGPGFDGTTDENTDVDVKVPSEQESDGPANERVLSDELQQLDFYLTRTLVEEAQSLLDDLQQRYHDHPELTRRAETLARLV